MRWFFLFVLVVNIAYLGWGLSSSSDEGLYASVPDLPKGAPTIVLLSELGKASKVAKVSDKKKQAEKKPDASLDTGDKARDDMPEAIAKKDQCYTLGPFKELIALRDFTRAIRNYVKTASFRSRDEKEQNTFRVFLKPAASLADAKALSKRLATMKVKDHYIINKGEEANAISLGHFKEKNRAYSHAASITKLGFSPVVEPVFKDYTLYWLDYRVVADKNVPSTIFEKHLSKKINHLQRQCA
jgi:hypothetical protein